MDWILPLWIVKGCLVEKLPSYGRLLWAAFSPSCQLHHYHHHHHHHHHHHVIGRERVNPGLKRLSDAKPCVFFRVKWLPWSPKYIGSLFPRLRASICKSCRQKAHRTVARARLAIIENVQNHQCRSTFGR